MKKIYTFCVLIGLLFVIQAKAVSPVITSFAPTSAAAGATVTITGTDFTGATAVSFGGTAATNVVVVNATTITAVVGSGSTGSVSVTTPGGTGTKTGFTFIPAPTITSFTPTIAAAGATVTITGTDFTGATAVSFGGTAATNVVVVNATTITAVVGSGSTGSVSVTTPGGTGTKTGFTFIPAPTITSFAPTSAAAGATVTITGTDFTGATAVSFGGTAATNVVVVNATTITAVVGSGSTGSVSVTTPGGTGTKTGFTFIPAPTITSFTPTIAAAGATVTITGTDFTGATAVSFGGTAATNVVVVNATTITAVVGSGSTGSVSVTTPGGIGTKTGFTFIPAPTITSFAPTSAAAGATVTITGTDFTGATAVSFGGTAAANVVVVNATTITAVVAGGTTGSVSVTSPGGIGTKTGFVFIQPSATVAVNVQGICQSGTSPVVTFSGSNGALPYTFSYSINGGSTQVVTTSGQNSSATVPVPTASANTFIYNLISVKDGNTNTQAISGQSVTVTVNPTPVITNINNIAPSICNGSNASVSLNVSTAGTLTWGGVHDNNSTYVNGPSSEGGTKPSAAANSTLNFGEALSNTDSTSSGVFNYTISFVSDKGCIAASQSTIPVTVNPTPIVNFSNAAPSICNGSSTSIAAHASTSGTFSWTGVGSSSKITGATTSGSLPAGSYLNISQPLANSDSVNSGIFTYTVSFTSSATPTCPAIAKTVPVTVNPTPIIKFDNASPIICTGSNTAISAHASTAGTFNWAGVGSSSKITGITSSGTLSAGSFLSISQPLSNSDSVASGTFTYTVTFTSAASPTCAASAVTIPVTVNPAPVITFVNSNPSICNGSSTSISAHASTAGTFNWTAVGSSSKITGVTSSGALSPGNIVSIVQPLANSDTSLPGTFTYTVTFASAVTPSCTATAAIIPVTVNPTPVVTFVNTAKSICNATATGIALHASTTGTFNWTAVTSGSTITGKLLSGTLQPGNNRLFIKDTLYNSSNTNTGNVKFTVTFTSDATPTCPALSTGPIVDSVNPSPAGPKFILAPKSPVCQNTTNQNVSVSANYSISAWQVINSTNSAKDRVVSVSKQNHNLNGVVSIYGGVDTIRVFETDSTRNTYCTTPKDSIIATTATTQDTAFVIFNGTDFVCLLNTGTANTLNGYQWGYDDDATLLADTIAGATQQNYHLGTGSRKPHYWVITNEGATCSTKNYYSQYVSTGDSAVVAPPGGQLHISVTPNPAVGNVVVSWGAAAAYTFTGKAMVTVTDMHGKKLIVQPFSTDYLFGQNTINVSRLPAGIYVVTVWDGDKQKGVTKLLKQ